MLAGQGIPPGEGKGCPRPTTCDAVLHCTGLSLEKSGFCFYSQLDNVRCCIALHQTITGKKVAFVSIHK